MGSIPTAGISLKALGSEVGAFLRTRELSGSSRKKCSSFETKALRECTDVANVHLPLAMKNRGDRRHCDSGLFSKLHLCEIICLDEVELHRKQLRARLLAMVRP